MKKIVLGGGKGPEVSRLACGLWRIHQLDVEKGRRFISYAMERGVNFFDIAAVYGWGAAEERLGEILRVDPSIRDKILIQTKCGNIATTDGMRYYDFSKEHIITSVEESLTRIRTDHLDVLLLHRPDALFEPSEVAEAFYALHKSGKVRWFGVSNQNPLQIELLSQNLDMPILINQMQFGLAHAGMISRNFLVNTDAYARTDCDDDVMDYCRLRGITVQAWSPLQYGDSAGTFLNNTDFPLINQALAQMGEKYGVDASAIAIAWILRHPAGIMPLLGTLNEKHLDDALAAVNVELSRVDWYRLFVAAGNKVR